MLRIARWQYWFAMAGWGGVAAGLAQLWPSLGAAAAPVLFVFVLLSALQHTAMARARFADLGYDPDDALAVLVPVANVWVFYRCLLQGTPSAEAHAKRVEKWQRAYGPQRVGAVMAVQRGGRTWLQGLPLFLPIAMVAGLGYGGANVLAMRFLDWLRTGDAATLDGATQAAGGAAGFLLLFTLIQLSRRQAVTRASWLPALLAVPLGLTALAMWLRTSRDLGMAVLSLPYEGLDLAWSSFVGGSLAFVWLAVGDRLARGDTLSDAWSKGMAKAGERWLDVVAVHGGAQTAIWIGLQVVLPGIHYAITYAFVDLAALFDADRPAYAWSTDVARGIRTRVFLTQFLAFMPYLVPSIAIAAFTGGVDPNAWVTAFMDPTTTPWWQHAIEGTLWVLSAALIKLSLRELYLDRVALLTAPATTAAPPPQDTKNPFAPPAEARG